MQRDGHMQTMVHPERVTYTPSLLDPTGPRENPAKGFKSYPASVEGPKVRERSATFADHYSQARLFFESQTEPEQNHIVGALVFELSKVEAPIVRAAMLGHLVNIRQDLGERVANGLGHDEPITPAATTVEARTDLAPSPKLSILKTATPTLEGRMIGCLVTDGADAKLVAAVDKAATAMKAVIKIVAPKLGGVTLSDGSKIAADHQLAGGPSVLFDTVVLALSEAGTTALLGEAAAIAWVHDAFAHLKVIGHTKAAKPLLTAAGVVSDAGVVTLAKATDASGYIDTAAKGRIWDREASVRTVY